MKTKPSSIDEIRQQTRELIEAHEKGIQDFHKNHFSHLCKREEEMSDIVEKLREYAQYAETRSERDTFEATIDEITRLREENARLREALKPFAEMELWTDTYPDGPTEATGKKRFVDPLWIVAARAAILGKVKAEAACPAPDEAL